MHIIRDSIECQYFLQDLCISLQRDFYGWHDWYLLHIHGQDVEKNLDAGSREALVSSLQGQFRGQDGAIAFLDDGSLLLLVQQKNGLSAAQIAAQLNHERSMHIPFLAVSALHARDDQKKILTLLHQHFNAESLVSFRKDDDKEVLRQLIPDIGNIIKVWMQASQQRLQRQKPQIMLVDDDPVTCQIINKCMRNEYPMITARNAVDAIKKHFLFGPDIVFLDIGLPDGNGFNVIGHIRNYDPHCHIIMFSGQDSAESRMRALSCGAAGFIEKPFHRKHFDHYINNWKHLRSIPAGH